jgi:hypothetical protein
LLWGCGGESKPKTEPQKLEANKPNQAGDQKEQPKRPQLNTAKPSAPKKPKAPEIPWQLTMPSGAKLDAFMREEGPNRFFLGRAGRFSGEYELRDGRLVMAKPLDRFETGFEWEVSGADQFTLVTQRPELTGNDYRGAIMKKATGERASQPSP